MLALPKGGCGAGGADLVASADFLACAAHLDWGYADQPPLIAAIAWLVRHTVAGTVLVELAGLMARGLGGARFTMGLSAFSTAIVGYSLVTHHLFTLNAFEPLFWRSCACGWRVRAL